MSINMNSTRANYDALSAMIELLGQFVECIGETRSDPYLRLSWLQARIEEEQARCAADWHTAAASKTNREQLEALMTHQIGASNLSGIRFVRHLIIGGDVADDALRMFNGDTSYQNGDRAASFGPIAYTPKGE